MQVSAHQSERSTSVSKNKLIAHFSICVSYNFSVSCFAGAAIAQYYPCRFGTYYETIYGREVK